MQFPYEIYRFLPANIKWFENTYYFSLPNLITKQLIRKGLEENLLTLKGEILYPTEELKEQFKEIKPNREIDWKKIEDCIEKLFKNSKEEFYQAKYVEDIVFKNPYFKQFELVFPLIENWKYLFIGEGHCFIPYFLEKGLKKEQVEIVEIDERIVEYFSKKGIKAYNSDARLLSHSVLPKAPYNVIVSYHIEYYQTYELVKLAQSNLAKYGYLYLFLTQSEEDQTFADLILVFETLYKFGFWINFLNPFIIQAIYIGFEELINFWEEYLELK
jgi:hypothetical protein